MSDRPSSARKSYRNLQIKGEWVGLYPTEDEDQAADNPWSLICEVHSTVNVFRTLGEIKSRVMAGGITPEWCEECMEEQPRLTGKEARAAQDATDQTLHICPPNCTIDHDAESRGAGSGPDNHLDVEGAAHPTVKSLSQHARLYGVEGVPETAAIFGLKLPQAILDLPEKGVRPGQKSKKNAKRVPRAKQAQQLLDLGHPWRVIENTLDLTRKQSEDLRKELNA